MNHNLFFVIFLIFSVFLKAQNSVEFKVQFLPNKKYETENLTYAKSYMNFKGDENFIKALKKQGISLPIISETSIISISETETGIEKNNKIPFVTNFKKVVKTQNQNGIETTTPDALEGSLIYGFYEDKKVSKIDSIQSDKLSPEIKIMLKNVIENSTQKINYPDKPLKIGDTFEQNVPMEFPLANFGKTTFLINTKYLLKEIKNGIALFDTTIDFILNSEIPEVKLNSSGSGKGFVEYDIINNFTKNNSLKYILEMDAQKDNFKITVKTDAESKYIMKLKD